MFHCVHFETPAQVGSENRPRIRGVDHAVAPIRPHHGEDSGGDAAVPEGLNPGMERPGSINAPEGAGEGLGAGRVRERSASSSRVEPVEGSVDQVEENGLNVEGAGALDLANPVEAHQDEGTDEEDK